MYRSDFSKQIRISEKMYNTLNDMKFDLRCKSYNAVFMKIFEETERYKIINEGLKKSNEIDMETIKKLLKLEGITREDLQNEN